jgi:hypothetical protein
MLKKPTAQTALLVFADIPMAIGTDTEKPKELFVANARLK